MKSVIKWVGLSLLGLALLLVLGSLFLFRGSGWGMMGGYGYGMMGPWGGYASPLGWLGMLFWMIVPLGLVVLLVAGGIWGASWVVNQHPSGQSVQNLASQACPHCGRSVQGDWKACPYCGSSLS